MCIRDRVTAWWRSGLAAMPVNLACLVIEAVALFRVVLLASVSYTHLRAHETVLDLVCRLLLEKKNEP